MQNSVQAVNPPRRLVRARQSNHHSYLLPKELEGYTEKALYRYIARWSYIRREYICCDDVSANFGISVRQATNIISIIHRRYSDTISCKIKRTKSDKGNVMKTHLLITDIKDVVKRRVQPQPKCSNGSSADMKMKKLKYAFLFYKKNDFTTDNFNKG